MRTELLVSRETGVREVLEILENIITEAGDLIESRSPELAAQARPARPNDARRRRNKFKKF
jgi:hypothetical protein